MLFTKLFQLYESGSNGSGTTYYIEVASDSGRASQRLAVDGEKLLTLLTRVDEVTEWIGGFVGLGDNVVITLSRVEELM
jgi:hypothetical protein